MAIASIAGLWENGVTGICRKRAGRIIAGWTEQKVIREIATRCWRRADSNRWSHLNLRQRRFSEHLSGLPRAASAWSRTRAERLLVDAAQRRHRYLLANRYRFCLGVSGTNGSNPLSSSSESSANCATSVFRRER
jgi:hypothetical protein